MDAQIAKLFDEDTTPKVEMVNGKPRISDEATVAQMERKRQHAEWKKPVACSCPLNDSSKRLMPIPTK